MHIPSTELFNVRKGDTVTIVVLREDVPVSVELMFDEDSKFTVYS